MKPNICNSKIVQWLLFLCIIVFSQYVFAQQNIGRQTILQFDSNHPVLRPDAPKLKEAVPTEPGEITPRFLRKVGGVSFDKVAQPTEEFKVGSIALNYNKNAADGSRLEVKINNETVHVFLPDWMLIPIAKYTASRYYSCVTLFGKLNDKTLEKQVTDKNGRIINYHPDLDNTLLGVRLAYMDMLVSYPFTSDLPKNSEGKHILGTGEAKSNANNNGAYYLSQHFIRTENKYMLTFRSYVISDFSRQITFEPVKDSLVISGYPFYYCWKAKSDSKDYDINIVAKEIAEKYNQQIKELLDSSGNTVVQNWIIEKIIELAGRYKDNYDFYSKGTFVDLFKLKSNEEKKQFLSKYQIESLFDILVETESYMDRDSVVYLKEFSEDISSKPELFEAANPAVWNATVNTMRFAAFFRYVKNNFPESWGGFLNQVKLLDPEPRIFTPTVMYENEK